MSTLGDLLGDANKGSLMKSSIEVGDVLYGVFDGINHPKYFVVCAMNESRALCCAAYINTDIPPFIYLKQHLLDLQVPLKKKENAFLKWDSFAACNSPMILSTEAVVQKVLGKSGKIKGKLTNQDLDSVRQAVIGSKVLTPFHLKEFFGQAPVPNIGE